ncbi:MAG: hypothetical protein J5565_02775 [Muribaculaceae bacterium]|nr:hypothetical protein [Muribaculaceae bacterium]
MKKVLLMFALFTSLCLFSCKDAATTTTENGDTTKTETVEKKVDINELAAKAKAEGANWSVDEWKAAFKDMLIGMKPMLDFMKDFKEKLEKDPAAAATLMEKMENNKEFESLEKAMGEFNTAAEACENGKKVLDDEEFGKQLLKELGYPEDVMK